MKQNPILLFLSEKNIEIVESILKNSDYFYEYFSDKNKIKSDLLILDSIFIEEKINLELSNFKKIICIIPKGYLSFIKKENKLPNIKFIELPITYSKLIKEL